MWCIYRRRYYIRLKKKKIKINVRSMDHEEVMYEPVVLPFTFIGCYNIRGYNIFHTWIISKMVICLWTTF